MNSEISASSPEHGNHPSFGWATAPRIRPSTPNDPHAFRMAMRHPSFPRSSAYDPEWVFGNIMGPVSLWLMEDLARHLDLRPGQRILDLGCGTAISSIFLAREFGVEVWAADLWIDPARNSERIAEAGLSGQVYPIHAEAHRLPFAHAFFDGVVSVDAYHYFGTEIRYLSYLAQFVKPGGPIGIVVPGNSADPDEVDSATLQEVWEMVGADWFAWRSDHWWRRHWSRTRCVDVKHAEMMADGRETWLRFAQAAEAVTGTPVAEQDDGRLLLAEAGRTLGFCRMIACRNEEAAMMFGPGPFMTRIA